MPGSTVQSIAVMPRIGRHVGLQHSYAGTTTLMDGQAVRENNQSLMNREKLFVYGTLRSNERANKLLGPDAVYLRDAKTKAEFSLYQVDWYPGLTKAVQPLSLERFGKFTLTNGHSSMHMKESPTTTIGGLSPWKKRWPKPISIPVRRRLRN